MDRSTALHELYRVARFSFLNYAQKGALPSVIDDADRRVMALFQELTAREEHYITRLYDLMADTGANPAGQSFDLKTSFFNFVRPTTLAQHFNEMTATEVATLEHLRAGLSGSDAVDGKIARLVDDFLVLRREAMHRVEELVSSLVAVVAAPAAKPPVAAK